MFEAAGIDADERERVAKAIELLASLPAETPVAVKKQIVEASLKAFGVPIDKIIEAGVSEIQALEGYIRAGAADTQKLLEESTHRIQQYEEEVKRIRLVMEQRVQEQQGVTVGLQREEAAGPAGTRVLRPGGGGPRRARRRPGSSIRPVTPASTH